MKPTHFGVRASGRIPREGILKPMRHLRLVLIASLLAFSPCAGHAAVQIVTTDGTVINGDIIAFQNGAYTVRTAFGPIQIPESSIRSRTEVGGAGQPAPFDQPLRLAGSTTIGDELAPALLEAYLATLGASGVTHRTGASPAEVDIAGNDRSGHPLLSHVSRLGSGNAFVALADRKADIGMASRRITPQEAARLAAGGMGDFTQPGLENVLALDGVIIVVNKANPVDALSIKQIRALFSGEITDWSQVGGRQGPVHLFRRDNNSGTTDTFNNLVMAGSSMVGRAQMTTGSDDLTIKVLGDPGGIGYAGFAYLGDNKALRVITDCGLEFPPSDLLVRTEEYPLSRRLYLYAQANPEHGGARPFIDFALGRQGQEIARRNNFIDLIPQVAPQQFGRTQIGQGIVTLAEIPATTREDMDAFMNYARRAGKGERITTTFRFQTGLSALDARAVRDIDRLVEFLRTPALTNKRVLVAGFADSVGSARDNANLSQQRANAVAALLQSKNLRPAEVIGFGRIAPVACNTDTDGREKNRRVEIWLY